jgi:hypothetical protein
MIAGAIFGAFLANDDIAGFNELAAKYLDAQSLRVAVSAVLG